MKTSRKSAPKRWRWWQISWASRTESKNKSSRLWPPKSKIKQRNSKNKLRFIRSRLRSKLARNNNCYKFWRSTKQNSKSFSRRPNLQSKTTRSLTMRSKCSKNARNSFNIKTFPSAPNLIFRVNQTLSLIRFNRKSTKSLLWSRNGLLKRRPCLPK